MQTVWSRVAQSQCLCNCANCSSATHAIARRATTAVARRRVRPSDAFTVFASSLAATAAVVDSRKKDARREHWDRIISEAKAQVQATEAEQQDRLEVLLQARDSDRSEEKGPEECIYALDDENGRGKAHIPRSARSKLPFDTWEDVFDWAAQHGKLRTASGFEDWRGLPLDLLRTLSTEQLNQLLRDNGMLRRFYGGPDCATLVVETSTHDLSSKKVKTLEYSIAKLVLKLLCYTVEPSRPSKGEIEDSADASFRSTEEALPGQSDVAVPSSSPKTSNCIPECFPAEVLMVQDDPLSGLLRALLEDEKYVEQKILDLQSRLEQLTWQTGNSDASKDFVSPPAPHYTSSVTTARDEARNLNTALFKILERTCDAQEFRPSISKICYRLLTSKTPPNTHTYNMLLVHFCHLDDRKMVRAVVTSMRESHIRPNEITHSTLLRYYTSSNNGTGFTDYSLRMEGENGGLALAPPGQQISRILHHRYRFFGENRSIAVEKARMNGEVYEALIVGTLRFYGPQTAMRHYRNMVSEGWEVGRETLTAILRSCCQAFDWAAGVSTWRQIIASTEGASTASYEWMLRLCQACGQQAAFDQILQLGVDAGALLSSLLDGPKYPERDASLERPETAKPQKQSISQPYRASPSMERQIESWEDEGTALTAEHQGASPPAQKVAVPESNIHLGKAQNSPPQLQTQPPDSQPQNHPPNAPNISVQLDPTPDPQLPISSPTTFPLIHDLSLKVHTLNTEDSQKMNSTEYKEYAYKLKGRLTRNGQITSRTLYEKYKREVQANLLEKESQKFDFSNPDALGSESSQESVSYSNEDDDLHKLLNDAITQSPPQNPPYSSSWHELEEPPASTSADLRG